MTPSLIAASIWALTGAFTALLPIRLQMLPGSLLLLSAVPLMIWIGIENGWIWAALALAAFLSMFRRPLIYLWARARGKNPEPPR